MLDITMLSCELIIPAGASIIVTKLRLHYAQIALSQGLQARETITIIESFFDFTIASDTIYFAIKTKADFFAEQRIQLYALNIIDAQEVFNLPGGVQLVP